MTPSPPQQFGRRLGGVPPALLGVVRPPGLHFSFGVKKSTGRLGSGGGPLLLSPHPTQTNIPPTTTPRSQSPSRCMSRLFPRDGDESGARVLRLRGCHGQGEGGETVGRGKAGPVLPRALDRLSAPSTPPRAAESGSVTGEGDAGEEGPRGSRGSLGMLRKGEGRHLPDARLRTCQGRNAQSWETPNDYLRRNRRGRGTQGGGPQG